MSYADIVNYTKKLKELDKSYCDEKLDETIKIYNEICKVRNFPSLTNILKNKLVQVVTAHEGPEKAKSLESSLS